MRDYSFGNFLCELRKRRGLSQYQLGALVGVSDKAVSKWENGASKPHSRIIFRLSEVLGVTADELLACKYRSLEKRDRKGIFAMKRKLWEKASLRLRECYGDMPDIAVTDRFESEKAEMQKMDMIVYLDVIAQIAQKAADTGAHIRVSGGTGASFVGYILGSTEIDPLPPHYYCPRCKSVEFSDAAPDGWDLPPKTCACGTEMQRSGHMIPFETYRHVVQGNTSFDICVAPDFFGPAKNIVFDCFKDSGIITLTHQRRLGAETYVICDSPEHVGETLDFDENYGKLSEYPSFTLLPTEELGFYGVIERETGVKFDNVPFWEREVFDAFKRGESDGISGFDSEFMKDMFESIAPSCCCDLIQAAGFAHGSGVFVGNAQDSIADGIPPHKLIAYRDDVFNYVMQKARERGVFGAGLAYSVMENTRRGLYAGGTPDVTLKHLREIGAEERFIASIQKIRYLFPKAHGVLYVKNAMILMWYKLHFPEVFRKVMRG